jgi:hypothetical protein
MKKMCIKSFNLNYSILKQEGWSKNEDKEDIASFKRSISRLNQKEVKNLNKISNHRFIALEGYQGERACVMHHKYSINRFEMDLVIQFSLSLTVEEMRDWIKEAAKFYKSNLVAKPEAIFNKQGIQSNKNRSRRVFEFPLGKVEYNLYSDSKPVGTGRIASEKKKYLEKRNKWIKSEYKKHRNKSFSQDDSYALIQSDLKKQSLKRFGNWPNKRDPESKKVIADSKNDPLFLSLDTIKKYAQREF